MNTFRLIRERLHVTQATLAEGLGVTQGNIAHYEKGQTVPPHVARKLISYAATLSAVLTFDEIYAEPGIEEPE